MNNRSKVLNRIVISDRSEVLKESEVINRSIISNTTEEPDNTVLRHNLRIVSALLIAAAMALIMTGCASRSEKAQEYAEEDMQKGDYNDAILQLDKVIENADMDNSNDVSLMLEAYYLKADCYTRLGDTASAAQTLSEAIIADEANPDAIRTATDYLRLGLAYIGTENYSSAINAFTKGLEMDEISCEKELTHNLIACYEKVGDWNSAKNLIQSYVNKYPEDTEMVQEQQFLSTR